VPTTVTPAEAAYTSGLWIQIVRTVGLITTWVAPPVSAARSESNST
jgi:hypothetical protein